VLVAARVVSRGLLAGIRQKLEQPIDPQHPVEPRLVVREVHGRVEVRLLQVEAIGVTLEEIEIVLRHPLTRALRPLGDGVAHHRVQCVAIA